MWYTWGNNAALRGASMRGMEYCDLNVSRGFGPERSGPLSRCLMLILRRGDRNKHRADTDQQVGVWRHREYLLCSVFATALLLIFDRFRQGEGRREGLQKNVPRNWCQCSQAHIRSYQRCSVWWS
mmetsp:Transcript_25287/g.37336  ORF Transcript_25287/g.37336 Transcript_25287/m.37336 type:complete len:125 (+) Transcript_25287:125-499(+)